MRTNIDIDDDLMAATIQWSGKATKKAAVEEAMRHYIKAKAFRGLVEGMRGIEWDDGLGDAADRPRDVELAEDTIPFEPKR